jgi:serine/threonine protein kinase
MTSSPSDLWLDRFLGEHDRYHLKVRLGGGSMGDVYLATDTRLGHQVALKILKGELMRTENLGQRFEREAELCAALRSEHIVAVADFGITPEGYPFYVMEYLQGQTLGQLMRQTGRLTVDDAVNIATQICQGLALAHAGVLLPQQGERIRVVHRDLKPENIFLTETSLGLLVKLLDFGIAKIQPEDRDKTDHTAIFIGTYHYASPEQIDIHRDLDGRSDIYSLGVILYEMLSGTDPFGLSAEMTQVSSIAWAMAHQSKSPLPLRQQPDGQGIPDQLEAIVLTCLAKRPQDRFASVQELRQALQSVRSQPRLPFSERSTAQNSASNAETVIKSQKLVLPLLSQKLPAKVSWVYQQRWLLPTALFGLVGTIAFTSQFRRPVPRVSQTPIYGQAIQRQPVAIESPEAESPQALLAQAKDFARQQDFYQAIQTASRISVKTPLYGEARAKIETWSMSLVTRAEYNLLHSNGSVSFDEVSRQLQIIPDHLLIQTDKAQDFIARVKPEWDREAANFAEIEQCVQSRPQPCIAAAQQVISKMRFQYWQGKTRRLIDEVEHPRRRSGSAATTSP